MSNFFFVIFFFLKVALSSCSPGSTELVYFQYLNLTIFRGACCCFVLGFFGGFFLPSCLLSYKGLNLFSVYT